MSPRAGSSTQPKSSTQTNQAGSSTQAGQAGPSAQTNQVQNAANTNNEQVKRRLAAVLDAQNNLEKALDQPVLQHTDVGKAGFDQKKLTGELKEELRKHEEAHDKEVEAVKVIVHHELQKKVLKERDDYVKKKVGNEISQQVKVQVETQISGFLPVTLGDQLSEANQRLEETKIALKNSAARFINGNINATDRSDWNRPLEKVSKDDGTNSRHYPQDLATLYQYNETNMRTLMTDYGLNVDKLKKENFNRFIQYIGVRGHLDEEVIVG